MKALILAAGLGSRLAPITDSLPKSLVPVNGKPILFQQIECLRGNGIEDITIVSGYLSSILTNRVKAAYDDITIVENADFGTTNNMYSALLGMRAMGEFDNVNLMMNADVFFDASVMSSLIACDHPNAIVVDMNRYMEESMKVVEEGGRIVHISKQVDPSSALGCSIDLYRFSENGIKAFYGICTDIIEGRGERNLWSEVALDETLAEIDFRACPLNGRWLEIDNYDDLKAAESLFA